MFQPGSDPARPPVTVFVRLSPSKLLLVLGIAATGTLVGF
jgi:hypothetical protein